MRVGGVEWQCPSRRTKAVGGGGFCFWHCKTTSGCLPEGGGPASRGHVDEYCRAKYRRHAADKPGLERQGKELARRPRCAHGDRDPAIGGGVMQGFQYESVPESRGRVQVTRCGPSVGVPGKTHETCGLRPPARGDESAARGTGEPPYIVPIWPEPPSARQMMSDTQAGTPQSRTPV